MLKQEILLNEHLEFVKIGMHLNLFYLKQFGVIQIVLTQL